MGKRYRKPNGAVKKPTVKKDRKQSDTVKKSTAKKTTSTGELARHLEEYAQRVWRGLSRKR
jgi:hypothetical protein